MRKPANWLQLVRFGLVGGVGFIVNLVVYTLCVHRSGWSTASPRWRRGSWPSANNFILNRTGRSTRAGDGPQAGGPLPLVSLIAEVFSLLVLTLLVENAGFVEGPRPGASLGLSMPLNFLGNKLWSFRHELSGPAGSSPPLRCGPGGRPSANLYSEFPHPEDLVQEMVIYGVSFDMVGKQPTCS